MGYLKEDVNSYGIPLEGASLLRPAPLQLLLQRPTTE